MRVGSRKFHNSARDDYEETKAYYHPGKRAAHRKEWRSHYNSSFYNHSSPSKFDPQYKRQLAKGEFRQPALSREDEARIAELEYQISKLPLPTPPADAFQLFCNKNFNTVKQKYPHLAKREIEAKMRDDWLFGVTEEEKQTFQEEAEESRKRYLKESEEHLEETNRLREEIHNIRFHGSGLVKPSGKLKYLTPFRVYRKECIAEMKEEHPDLLSKERHQMIKAQWKKLDEDKKFVYVLKSRVDQEKQKYLNTLQQLIEETKSKISKGKVFDYEQRQVRESLEQQIENEKTKI